MKFLIRKIVDTESASQLLKTSDKATISGGLTLDGKSYRIDNDVEDQPIIEIRFLEKFSDEFKHNLGHVVMCWIQNPKYELGDR